MTFAKRQGLDPNNHKCPIGCFGRKIDGDSWFTWWFHHPPGTFVSSKRTPLRTIPCAWPLRGVMRPLFQGLRTANSSVKGVVDLTRQARRLVGRSAGFRLGVALPAVSQLGSCLFLVLPAFLLHGLV